MTLIFFGLLYFSEAHATTDFPRRTDAGMCEVFLAPAFTESAIFSMIDLLAFADGRRLDMAIEQNNILHEDSLRNLDLHLPAGHIAYDSPFGVTIWKQQDFDSWITLQSLIDWNSPAQVQELLSHLMENVPLTGVSWQMQMRLQNSLLAHVRAKRKAVNEAQIPEAFLSLPEAKQEELLSVLAEIARARVYEEVAEAVRSQVPSLNIEFGPNNEIETYLDAVWIGRMVLREPLLRHLWHQPGQEEMQEETVFLLAAFPELVPFWPLVQKWRIDFRHYRLNLQTGFYPMPVGPLNAQGDSLLLDLRHSFSTIQGRRTETAHLKLIIHGERERLTKFIASEWPAFLKVKGLRNSPPPSLEDSDIEGFALQPRRGISRSQLLAFYFYLSYRYPQKNAS